MMGNADPLVVISELAMHGRLARISYSKPGERAWTVRIVEPYALVGNGWRSFRVDRITSVSDGGGAFAPRSRVALGGSNLYEYQTAVADPDDRDPETVYRRYLQGAVLDGNFDEDEIAHAAELAEGLSFEALKVAHAHVFAAVIHEVLLDGQIQDHETVFLDNVRRALQRLGWAP
jgi:hypothetical protein